MDLDWAKIISVITAFVTLATAVLTYLREKIKTPSEPSLTNLRERIKKPSESSSSARLRIRHLSRSAGAPWISVFLWVSLPVTAILGVLILVVSVLRFILEPSLGLAGAIAFWALCMVIIGISFRALMRGSDAPSKVRREARLTIDGNYEAVFDRCESAIRKLGARIISLDRDSGQIYARTGLTWQSFGERMHISVMRQGDTVCSVALTSDSVIPTTLVDYGKNSKNLEILVENL
jgi:hypothetical protein